MDIDPEQAIAEYDAANNGDQGNDNPGPAGNDDNGDAGQSGSDLGAAGNQPTGGDEVQPPANTGGADAGGDSGAGAPVQPSPAPAGAAEAKPEQVAAPKEDDKPELEESVREKMLPDDYQPANWKESVEKAVEIAKAEIKAEEAKAKSDAAKAEADRTAQLKAIQDEYDREISSLTESKRLPAGEDGTKRQAAVWQYINDVNSKRAQAGSRNFITSFEDGLNLLEYREAAEAKVKQEEANRKARGSMIGGTSGSKVPANPVGGLRRGMTLDDIIDQELGA